MSDKKRRLSTRTADELEKLGEGMTNKPAKPAAPPAKKPTRKSETVGVGRDMAAENRARLMRDLDARIAAARAANNMDLVNKYMARKKALEAL